MCNEKIGTEGFIATKPHLISSARGSDESTGGPSVAVPETKLR